MQQVCVSAPYKRSWPCHPPTSEARARGVQFRRMQQGGGAIQVCGPPPMMEAVSGDKNPDKSQGEVSGVLADLGYTKDMVFKF